MINSIFDKTEKGREEIATRMHHLAPRLRTLLVLVDGKQSSDDLLKKVVGIGLNEESITELLNGGFIQSVVIEHSTPPTANAQTSEPASSAEAVLPEGQNQFQAIYHFYNETIKSTIGLRGYALQLKVEKAASVEEFRALRKPYLDAVLKVRGSEMERSLRIRLDQLLYLGESAPPNTATGMHAGSAE
ncbi:MAG: hypothetical protein ACREX0_03290 [Noviherbaspirillum sp.]